MEFKTIYAKMSEPERKEQLKESSDRLVSGRMGWWEYELNTERLVLEPSTRRENKRWVLSDN